ncbi:MAG: DUF177 domain-containing protein [Rhodobacteraceae bacterium]|nr:DUF177 domain-containing protein [Paracoccaceae bacterium]
MTRDAIDGEILQADIPFKHIYEVEALAKSGRDHAVSLEASLAERTAIAEFLELEAVDSMRLTGTLAREGRSDWRFDGRLEAQVAQRCVVTLEPTPAAISEAMAHVWSPNAAAGQTADAAINDATFGVDPEADDDPPEPLGAEIDLGAAAVEALSLALDPYPRAADAALDATLAGPPGVAPLTDEALRPFAGLAALRESMDATDDAPPDSAEKPPSRKDENDP